MASFRDLLTAGDAELVKIFYKVRPSDDGDFIRKINHVARQLGVNHSQLVCALGFNHHVRELTDILFMVGFSSYKPLCYRRNELFTNDAYRKLDIDNVLDIYAGHLDDEQTLAALRELVGPRLSHIEAAIGAGGDPALTVSYKMEVHSIYTGGIATPEFVMRRVEAPIGDLRVMIEEMHMILEAATVPASNLFFSDFLLPEEKRVLIESGGIDRAMIENRLSNDEVSEDERQMLEDSLPPA